MRKTEGGVRYGTEISAVDQFDTIFSTDLCT